METGYYVYMIETEKGRLYTGIAINPEKRFYEHLFDRKKGAKFFRTDSPEKIVYIESYPTKSAALRREIAIKKLSRKAKLNLWQNYLGKKSELT